MVRGEKGGEGEGLSVGPASILLEPTPNLCKDLRMEETDDARGTILQDKTRESVFFGWCGVGVGLMLVLVWVVCCVLRVGRVRLGGL